MTIPASATTGQRRDPTRIGQARPSHLISTTGVGAIVDLPSMSVIVRGLDAWNPERQETVFEPRLLDTVRGVLGPQVRGLRHAPWDPSESDDPWTRVGVPVTPFPRWVRCPSCYRLGPLDPPDQFELVHRWGRRPDLAKIVHARCLRQQNKRVARRRACVPARFMVVCERGHLDDFPYVEFVHANRDGGICDGPQLSVHDAASTLGPQVTVRCVCDASGERADELDRVFPVHHGVSSVPVLTLFALVDGVEQIRAGAVNGGVTDSPVVRHRKSFFWRFRQEEQPDRCMRGLGVVLQLLQGGKLLAVFPR